MSALRTLPHEMCFLYTREEVVCSQDNFPTRCVFSIPVRKFCLRTLPHEMCFLYTREEVLISGQLPHEMCFLYTREEVV